MTAPQCAMECGRPSPSAVICGDCQAALRRALQLAAAIAGDLDAAVARQLRHGHGGRPSEPPLPYDPAAADTAMTLRTVLADVTGRLAAEDGKLPPRAIGIGAMAKWMERQVPRIAARADAAAICTDIRHAVDRAVKVLDGPPERHPAGQCGACGRALLAPPGADEARCPWCGTVATGIAAARMARIEQAEVIGTAQEISGALKRLLDITLPAATIRSWHSRGRLSERAGGGLAMSEVLKLKAESDQRRSRA